MHHKLKRQNSIFNLSVSSKLKNKLVRVKSQDALRSQSSSNPSSKRMTRLKSCEAITRMTSTTETMTSISTLKKNSRFRSPTKSEYDDFTDHSRPSELVKTKSAESGLRLSLHKLSKDYTSKTKRASSKDSKTKRIMTKFTTDYLNKNHPEIKDLSEYTENLGLFSSQIKTQKSANSGNTTERLFYDEEPFSLAASALTAPQLIRSTSKSNSQGTILQSLDVPFSRSKSDMVFGVLEKSIQNKLKCQVKPSKLSAIKNYSYDKRNFTKLKDYEGHVNKNFDNLMKKMNCEDVDSLNVRLNQPALRLKPSFSIDNHVEIEHHGLSNSQCRNSNHTFETNTEDFESEDPYGMVMKRKNQEPFSQAEMPENINSPPQKDAKEILTSIMNEIEDDLVSMNQAPSLPTKKPVSFDLKREKPINFGLEPLPVMLEPTLNNSNQKSSPKYETPDLSRCQKIITRYQPKIKPDSNPNSPKSPHQSPPSSPRSVLESSQNSSQNSCIKQQNNEESAICKCYLQPEPLLNTKTKLFRQRSRELSYKSDTSKKTIGVGGTLWDESTGNFEGFLSKTELNIPAVRRPSIHPSMEDRDLKSEISPRRGLSRQDSSTSNLAKTQSKSQPHLLTEIFPPLGVPEQNTKHTPFDIYDTLLQNVTHCQKNPSLDRSISAHKYDEQEVYDTVTRHLLTLNPALDINSIYNKPMSAVSMNRSMNKSKTLTAITRLKEFSNNSFDNTTLNTAFTQQNNHHQTQLNTQNCNAFNFENLNSGENKLPAVENKISAAYSNFNRLRSIDQHFDFTCQAPKETALSQTAGSEDITDDAGLPQGPESPKSVSTKSLKNDFTEPLSPLSIRKSESFFNKIKKSASKELLRS